MTAREKHLITREEGIENHELWSQKEQGLYPAFLLSPIVITGVFFFFFFFLRVSPFVKQE